MQVKIIVGREVHDFFKNWFWAFMIFLRQSNMIEQALIFVFVYVNFLFKMNSAMWVDAGSRGVSTIGVKNQKLFMRGGRAVEQ